MPAGRPPRAPEDGDEEYYEEGEEHQNQYEEGEEAFPQAEEGEEGPTGEEDEEHDDEASSSSSEESVDVVEYIPPPEERPFPPPTTQGGVPFHYIIDLGAIASEATSGNDTRKLVLPSPQENDPRYPKWLHYILNDDYPSLSYLIHPPPGAEIDLTTHDKNNNAANQGDGENNNNNGEEDDEEGEDEECLPRRRFTMHHSPDQISAFGPDRPAQTPMSRGNDVLLQCLLPGTPITIIL